MTLAFHSEQNGWLPFSGPFCWNRSFGACNRTSSQVGAKHRHRTTTFEFNIMLRPPRIPQNLLLPATQPL